MYENGISNYNSERVKRVFQMLKIEYEMALGEQQKKSNDGHYGNMVISKKWDENIKDVR